MPTNIGKQTEMLGFLKKLQQANIFTKKLSAVLLKIWLKAFLLTAGFSAASGNKIAGKFNVIGKISLSIAI